MIYNIDLDEIERSIHDSNNTITNKITSIILKNAVEYYIKYSKRPNIYISLGLIDGMNIYQHIQIRPNTHNNDKEKPFGTLAGHDFYITDLLDGISYFIGTDVKVYQRKEKLKKILNEIRDR